MLCSWLRRSIVLIFCIPDQKPKDNREFAKWELARKPINDRSVSWQKQEVTLLADSPTLQEKAGSPKCAG